MGIIPKTLDLLQSLHRIKKNSELASKLYIYLKDKDIYPWIIAIIYYVSIWKFVANMNENKDHRSSKTP